MAAGEIEVQKSSTIQTFIVDQDGIINFPVVGRIALAGLTKSQAIERIKKLVSDHINVDPVINLRIISFKIVVLGEVQIPGAIQVSDEKMSILDAIGTAGDLTIYGNRKNVLLIRENDNGAVDHVRFDLTSPDLFASPYYYLQQNDKIIVEPNRTRQLESKYGPADGYRLSVLSMVFGALSIVASTTIAIISLSR
jgi:polysaccharide export outer membrane protein